VKKTLIPAFILASTLSLTATAADDSAWFSSLAIGESSLSTVDLEDAISHKVALGYGFNRNWALGVEYTDLGEFHRTDVPVGFEAFVEVYGFNYFGMFSFPVSDAFSVFAKAGIYHWNIKPSGNTDFDEQDFAWGVGTALNIHKDAALTLEFQRFEVAEEAIDAITVGITFYSR